MKEENCRNCLKEILDSGCKVETEEELAEKLKEIEEKYGEENTRKVARALLAILHEKVKEKQEDKI